MTYERFAYVYDELMKDIPYDSWVQIINDMRSKYQVNGHRLLDLACGTGELSVRLASAGFDVTGVDLSADMLAVAQAKADNDNRKIDFLQQDMAQLELINTYDIIGIFCDSLNYLQTEEEVVQTFNKVHQYLEKDGLFIFDVHSIFKMNEIFLDQTFTYDEDGVCYIWNCFQGEFSNSVDHELTFFVEDDIGKYDRFDEYHTQRTYSIETYSKWLEETGFEILETLGDFTGNVTPKSERIFFITRKK